MIRTVNTDDIVKNIKEMCIEANHYLSKDMDKALKDATASEKSELGKKILNQLQENLKIADEEMIPICQDTGMAVIFLEVGLLLCFLCMQQFSLLLLRSIQQISLLHFLQTLQFFLFFPPQRVLFFLWWMILSPPVSSLLTQQILRFLLSHSLEDLLYFLFCLKFL